jgi:hypothetical protein
MEKVAPHPRCCRFADHVLTRPEKTNAPTMDRGTRPCGSRGEWDLHTWGDFERIAVRGSCQNQIGES